MMPRSRGRRRGSARHLRPCGLALAALLALCPAASRGQTSMADLEAQLSQARDRLVSPGLTAQARLEALLRCDDVQKRLIAVAPADDRVPTWLADRAACALDLAGEDGSDVAVLFGVPTRSQLKIVRSRAREAQELASRADQAAAQVVARLEAQLVNRAPRTQGGPTAAAIENALHVLVDIEQTQRIPHLRALATLLLGAAATDEPGRETAHAAARQLGALAGTAQGLDDARRIALGGALIHASIGSPERASEALKAAAAQFQPVADKYTPGDASHAGAISLKARLGLLRAGQDLPARARSSDLASEQQIDALEAEARAAALLDRSLREPGARALLVSAAIRALLDGSGPRSPDQPPSPAALSKIAAAIPAGLPMDRLPPEAALAWAVVRVRDGAPGDPAARSEAMATLARLADSAEAPAALRTQARWERAVLAGVAGDPLGEVDAVAAVFRTDPACAKALPAAKRTVDLFSHNCPGLMTSADSAAPVPEAWLARVPALREALALLIRRDSASTARWCQEAVRLSARELATSSAPDAVERALALVETVIPAAQQPLAAGALSDPLWRALDRRRSAAARLEDAPTPSAAKAEWESMVEPAERALAWARTSDRDRAPAYALLLGESLTGVGNPSAMATLAPLSGGALDRPESPLWTRLRFALARAMRQSGDHAGAIAALREVADRFEGTPGNPPREPAYWAAWAEMLAILQSQNDSGARSPDIRVQIKRLELLDPRLGGPPHADRIRQVRLAVGE